MMKSLKIECALNNEDSLTIVERADAEFSVRIDVNLISSDDAKYIILSEDSQDILINWLQEHRANKLLIKEGMYGT